MTFLLICSESLFRYIKLTAPAVEPILVLSTSFPCASYNALFPLFGQQKNLESINGLKVCTQFTSTLKKLQYPRTGDRSTLPSPPDPRSGRQVFWLSDHSTCRTFPSRFSETVVCLRLSSPITAAGPLPLCTEFPIKPRWIPSRYDTHTNKDLQNPSRANTIQEFPYGH